MTADQLLQSLAVQVGLTGLRFDRSGCARLAVDGAPALNLERTDEGYVLLYSELGRVPYGNLEAVFAKLLEANLFCTATGGGALALDRGKGEVLLCARVAATNCTAHGFVQLVDRFVSAAKDWQSRLQNHNLRS